MATPPKMTATDAERILLKGGFTLAGSKGKHRAYVDGAVCVIVPQLGTRPLCTKTVRQIGKTLAL